jgi:hypothetical protein
MDAGRRSGVPPQTRADAVQRLTLDCTDSDGPTSTCPVDLMADDTFTPRERGKDRPALTGDPLSYTRSELIEAGYGLRPDPDKDRAAYARWLTAARPLCRGGSSRSNVRAAIRTPGPRRTPARGPAP